MLYVFRIVGLIAALIVPSIGAGQTFGTVNFNFDSDQLDAQGRVQVQAIAQQLKNVNSYKPTVIVGYTDAVGSDAYNQNLGQRRAETVANALMALGVSVDRIGATSSRGKNDLLIAVASAERRNRRVTVGLAEILAACRSYRDIELSQAAVGAELQNDVSARLQEAAANYRQLTGTGANGPAFQMAGAAREDCRVATGFNGDSLRKIEYAKRCFCSSARMRVALGR